MSNYSLPLSPDPELLWMEGEHTVVDIDGDSGGAGTGVPSQGILSLSVKDLNSQRPYDGLLGYFQEGLVMGKALSRVSAPPSRQPRYEVVQVKGNTTGQPFSPLSPPSADARSQL